MTTTLFENKTACLLFMRMWGKTAQHIAFLALAACFLALPAHAEIGVQNSGGALLVDYNASSYTQSVTVGDGKDRILVVSIHTRNALDPSSVTYGGTPLTYAANSRVTSQAWPAGVRTQFYYLLNPPVGTTNLTATFSTAPWKIGMRRLVLTGAKQQAPEAVAKTGVSSNAVSTTTTTLSAGALLVSAVTHYDKLDVTPASPLVSRGTAKNPISIGTATLLTDEPGAFTTEWTAGSSSYFTQSVLSFAPAQPAATLVTLR